MDFILITRLYFYFIFEEKRTNSFTFFHLNLNLNYFSQLIYNYTLSQFFSPNFDEYLNFIYQNSYKSQFILTIIKLHSQYNLQIHPSPPSKINLNLLLPQLDIFFQIHLNYYLHIHPLFFRLL